MRIFKRSPSDKIWQIEFRINKKQIRESTHTADRATALEYLHRRVTAAKAGVFASPNLKFERLVELIEEDYEVNELRSADYLKYRLAPLMAAFGGFRVSDITTDLIENYKKDRLRENAARATINLQLAALSKMFNLAMARELIVRKPTIKRFNVDGNSRQGFVTIAQYNAMRAHLPDWSHNLTDWLYLSGMRIGAALQLEWRDYDGDFIHVRREIEKTDKPNELPLEGRFREVIERALEARDLRCKMIFHYDGAPLSPRTIQRLVPAASLAAGLSRIIPHDFRRSAIKNMVDAGIDPQVAMTFSGHKTRKVFDLYRIVNHETRRRALKLLDDHLDAQADASHAAISLNARIKRAHN